MTSEHIWTDDDRLTWEELQANVACRGCGLPFFDRRRPMPPILRRTPREVAIAAIEEHDWRTRHGDCHAVTASPTGRPIAAGVARRHR
jgi:hypothetical protein